MSSAGTSWGLFSPDGAFFKFVNANFYIGRAPDLDLTLKSRSVDKRHAVITANFARNLYQLHDLGTLNGTFVNEVCVRRVVSLKLTDNIRFGYDTICSSVKFVSATSVDNISTFRVDLCPKEIYSRSEHSALQMDGDRLWEVNNNSKVVPQHAQHYPPCNCSVSPDSYPLSPPYRHSPAVTCPCPSCIGPRGSHPQLNGPRANYGPYGFHGYPGWPHMMPPFLHSSHAPSLPERPATAYEERSEIVAKRSPLYGQPPWWGWGSDDEVYSYPHTSSFIEETEASPDVTTSQHTVMLRKKKLLTKKEAVELAHKHHTVAVLSESREQIFTRTAGMHFETENKNGGENERVVYRRKAAIPFTPQQNQLSPVFEQCTSADWETVEAVRSRDQMFGNSSEGKTYSDEDSPASNFRNSLTYEIPFIPDFGEIPDKPVNERSERKVCNKEKGGKKSGERNSSPKRKGTSKLKRRPGVEKSGRSSQTAARKASTSSGASDTTSESECEAHSQRMKRRSGAGAPKPHGRVFGLTEVNSDNLESSDAREVLTPVPSMPGWTQQRTPGTSGVVLVSGSSSAVEDSLNSSMTSTGSSMSGIQPNSSGPNPMKETKTSSDATRSRSATTGASPRSFARSASAPHSSKSSPPKASSSSVKVSRSKTMTAVLRRSYPSTGNNDVSTKSPRSRCVSSVSDESEADHQNGVSPKQQPRDAKIGGEENGRKPEQSVTDKEGKNVSNKQAASSVSSPRGNKTAKLRAQSSRENVKNALKGKGSALAVRPRSTKLPSPSTNSPRSPSPTIKRVTKSPSDQPTAKSFDFSSEMAKDFSRQQANGSLNGSHDSTQEAVDEIFRNADRSSTLPESLQMKREDPINRTFVLDEGNQEESLSQVCADSPSPSSPTDQESRTSAPRPELPDHTPPNSDAEGSGQGNSRAQHRLIPFSLLSPTRAFPPPFSDKPFTPPSESRSETEAKCIAGSPKSAKSLSPTKSPSPPPMGKIPIAGQEGSSQARRQWDVTDKPVEDLMLSSIHAFSVELRLASESVLSKVKGLYEGSEKFPGETRPRSNSEGKQEPQSAIPDWKSSHAEIAGVFRNLRKVELRLRTMDQALSIMCQSTVKKEPEEIQTPERRFSMADMSKLGSQNWRDFKIRARRTSWAIEHRSQFPVPAESEEEEEEEDSP